MVQDLIDCEARASSDPCWAPTELNEAWRINSNGATHRPGGPHSKDGYACTFWKDLGWFRFTGDAGTRLQNTCPRLGSCGTQIPYWTDATMPEKVKEVVTITVYGSERRYNKPDKCKLNPRPLEVMRCSNRTQFDFIYRVPSDYTEFCSSAFCSM
ncbi:uromodulin-like [Watersipora subatra]|uniref:uromodulin-like n=1 Tax=Watersipora subatra TaxID=2589382 RepID=UPI00355AF34F